MKYFLIFLSLLMLDICSDLSNARASAAVDDEDPQEDWARIEKRVHEEEILSERGYFTSESGTVMTSIQPGTFKALSEMLQKSRMNALKEGNSINAPFLECTPCLLESDQLMLKWELRENKSFSKTSQLSVRETIIKEAINGISPFLGSALTLEDFPPDVCW